MQGIIFLLGVVFLYIIVDNYYRIQWKRKNWEQIKENFGAKPVHKEKDIKRIRFYVENQNREREVDEITWNDLSMDEVFWRINSCASSVGEQVLYSTLHDTGKTKEELETLEESVQYFSNYEKERNQILTKLSQMGKKDAAYYIPQYMDSIEENRIGFGMIFRFLQILPVLFLICFAITKNSLFVGLFAANLIGNVVIYALIKMRYETNLAMLGILCSILKTGEGISKLECKEKLCQGMKEPLKKLKRAGGIIEKMQAVQETMLTSELGILGDYILGATLWHLTAYNKSINRIIQYQEEYKKLYEMVGSIDMAISVASFRKSVLFYCVPEFWEEKQMKWKEVYHPLIDEPVCNSMDWKRNCIITGANASGKSTFIKTIAINAILAHTIHTCLAQSVKMPCADIVTSMAVQDDIMSGDSYFIKEIKYLKRMLERLNTNRCTICIVDEILRGTNTRERIAASRAIMEYLCRENCLAMVASHDQELTVLLADKYDNYHFSEKIEEKNILFDYKLYPGPANSQNAIRLLEYVGFPEQIIADAQKNAEI